MLCTGKSGGGTKGGGSACPPVPRAAPTDKGPCPYTVNIARAAAQNRSFRTALWTGKYLQLTLMSLGRGEDIGLEVHPCTDQFICIVQGKCTVKMGNAKNSLNLTSAVCAGCAVFIPAGTWHNVINTGASPLKLYSIYAPAQHPFGTVQKTKKDAKAAEK